MAGFFAMVYSEKKIVEMLGIEKTTHIALSPSQLIEEGIPMGALSRVKQRAGLSDKQMAQTVGISERTLNRRTHDASTQADKPLSPSESDRLFRLAHIIAQAEDVLGDLTEAQRWLKQPNPALEGHTPLEMIKTEPGARQVEQLLNRIDQGIFA
jgi:putative toxin-antitoxin system antitoxin component (TIGR02293 family)